MFVVAMTIAVLGAIGMWAIQSAALEVRMAGFGRQATQTHYLAEYGALAATAFDEIIVREDKSLRGRAAGVSAANVVVGAIDPNERTHGRGIARMRDAGIAVDVVDDPRCHDLIERFAFSVRGLSPRRRCPAHDASPSPSNAISTQ